MLDVVAEVEHDEVERPVVRVRSLVVRRLEQVVLRDEVAGQRVAPEAQHRAQQQVRQRPPAQRVQDAEVERDLHQAVDHLPRPQLRRTCSCFMFMFMFTHSDARSQVTSMSVHLSVFTARARTGR